MPLDESVSNNAQHYGVSMEEGARPLSDIPAINRFLSYCRIRTVPSKTVVIHAGDLPDVLYYIVSGSVEVMIEDEEGNEMVLAYLNKGQFFGEMGLFYEQPTRSAWCARASSASSRNDLSPLPPARGREPGLVFELRRSSPRAWTAPIASSAISPSWTSPAASRTRSWTCAASRTR